METTKLTIRVRRELLNNLKRYAELRQTTVTRLIESYMQQIPAQDPLGDAPIVRRLTGIVPSRFSEEDYKRHLDEKYDG
ncbi:MAG: hypothetical protein HPY76_08665 [Anaerolineae bacterium]|nr:hypothetical protein [Anaerolineae bacterium]